MDNYFQIIPQEVITSLSKNLDQKSLCNLIMCSKEFKELCDTNDIWKYHYYRTIKHKWRIKEDSVHTGGYNFHHQQYLYEYYDDTGKKHIIKSNSDPSARHIILSSGRVWPPSPTQCLSCSPEKYKNLKFIRSLGCKPYIFPYPYTYHPVDRTIRTGCMCYQFNDIKNEGFVYSKPPDEVMDMAAWKKDIYEKWKTYNESKGLNKLCQDPLHYDIDTLDIPSSHREFKNYKKVIIKKLYTQNKKSPLSNKFKRDKKTEEINIARLKKRIESSQNQIIKADQNIEKEKNKSERLKIALESMK